MFVKVYISFKFAFSVVFMGSEKYPDVNSLDDYLSKHGGETNAWTDNEKVVASYYYMMIPSY